MRMWMVDPEIMCKKHLLGEHVETHMFVGTLLKKKSINGYIENDLFEPLALLSRHDLLVKEMEKRGMNHKSPLLNDISFDELISYLSPEHIEHSIDWQNSILDLIGRCDECAKLFNKKLHRP